MNKETIIKIIVFFLIPIQLLLFTFLVPPFQKPDEQLHFEKSLIISKGYFFCQKKSGNTVVIERKYYELIKNPYLDLLTRKKSAKLPLPAFYNDLFSKKQANEKINFNVDQLCSFPIISYLPQALILKIASLFNLNAFLSIYLIRFFMALLSYFWFLYLYRKINDKYKLIILFTFALPMTLHQVSSFSYDVANIMFSLTFFTLFVNNYFKKKIEFAQLVKLFFILFLLVWSKKIGYETFFLFLFLLPLETKPFILSTLVFIPFYILSKLNGLSDFQSSLTSLVVNPTHQLNFLLTNPLNIFKVIILTSIHRMGFYLQSLIGIFGWLEYGLDPLSYFIYGLFFIYILVNVKLPDKLKLSRNRNIVLSVILLISYIFILLLAFLFNTPSGSIIVQGVQGRYFIPLLPFVIFLIMQIKDNLIFQKILYWLTIIFLIAAVFYSIFHRYY